MKHLKRFGIDTYMLLLLATVAVGLILPAQGLGAEVLRVVTFAAVALLFFLYGAKLDPSAVRDGLLNWKVQGLTFAATYVMFPLLGLGFASVFGGLLGPEVTMGLMFLAVLPSTVQSSIAFTGLARGNVPAAICAASLSNIIGVALTPLLVAWLLAQKGAGIDGHAVVKIAVQILLPFAIGQVLRPVIGDVIAKHRSATLLVDRGSILLIVYAAFSAGTVSGLWSAIPPVTMVSLFAVVLLFLAVSMALMVMVGRAVHLSDEDQQVLFFCGSTKSLATGLPIATALFPVAILGATVLPLMIYHMSQLLVCAVVAQRRANTPQS